MVTGRAGAAWTQLRDLAGECGHRVVTAHGLLGRAASAVDGRRRWPHRSAAAGPRVCAVRGRARRGCRGGREGRDGEHAVHTTSLGSAERTRDRAAETALPVVPVTPTLPRCGAHRGEAGGTGGCASGRGAARVVPAKGSPPRTAARDPPCDRRGLGTRPRPRDPHDGAGPVTPPRRAGAASARRQHGVSAARAEATGPVRAARPAAGPPGP